jgi:sec-independent protein translocase protein TatA
MGGMSWIHWVIVIAVVALLFGGRGKLSGIMGDAAKGIKAFKDGLKDDTVRRGRRQQGPAPLPRTEREKRRSSRLFVGRFSKGRDGRGRSLRARFGRFALRRVHAS